MGHLFTLRIIGNSGVGKTSLIRRFADDTFSPNNSSIGVDFKARFITIDGQRIKLQIWDKFGAGRSFRALSAVHFRGTHGIVVVYDVTSSKSFDDVRTNWLPEIISKLCDPRVLKILVGNKCDDSEHRVVLEADAQRFAEEMNIQFFETSARDNINVDEMFNAIARLVFDDKARSLNNKSVSHQRVRSLEPPIKRHKSDNSCCAML